MEVKRSHPLPDKLPNPTAPAPLRMVDSFPSTFPELLANAARTYGKRVYLPRRSASDHTSIPFDRVAHDVDRLAAALLDLGLRHGDHVGLIAENRYEWLICDMAMTSLGIADVPRGSDTTPTEIEFILRHSGCKASFAENDAVAKDLLARREALPELQHVIVMADETVCDGALALGDLLKRGDEILALTALAQANPSQATEPENGREARGAARAKVAPHDLLTIVYTSGTTAEPKGVMLTHDNVLQNIRVCIDVLNISATDRFLSVLPAWHMYERIMDYLALAAGSELVYTDRRKIKEDLKQCQPTIFAAVPRIWEMLHDGVVNHAMKLKGTQGRLFRKSLALSRLVGGRKAGPLQRIQQKVLDKLVNKKVRANLGGRLRLCVSGGGALPRHVDETFLGMGLPLRNGYGLTETSPVASIRLPHQTAPGHIGPPLPHTRIEARRDDGSAVPQGDTGVLWIHGPQIMQGYYENPGKTGEVLTEDGWFNSGDLGHVDAEGNVWITGRAKDTIVLAGGENVEPEPIETLIKTSPLIEQAVVVGQDEKALGVLIVPMRETLEQKVPMASWDEREGVLHGDEVRKLFRKELDRVITRENGCRPTDRVATLQVLSEPMTPENGLLTQTLKVRRHVVVERFQSVIDALFGRG
ncbi:MAG: long-chain fatty acid--CoA ligase [Planctomycetota bacterium]